MFSQLFGAGQRSEASGPEAAGDGSHYTFKPSLVGSAWQFDLTGEGLSWQVKGKHGVWPLEKIAAIRLSYRPVSMQSRRFRADIEDTRGERVTIYSTTWHTVALMSPQDNGYRAFIVELHRRLAAIGSKAVLVVGINRAIYVAGLAVLVIVTHWPMTKLLPVWTVSDLEPVPIARLVVLVALVPGALTAVAALDEALTT